jgi:methyl coenzyme M reductase beta subunit
LFDFLVEIRGFVNYFGGGKGIELVMKIVKEKEKNGTVGNILSSWGLCCAITKAQIKQIMHSFKLLNYSTASPSSTQSY